MSPMKYDLTYLSLGAGVQSSAMLVMAALGLHGCPRPDVVLFADTRGEGPWTYAHLPLMIDFAKQHGLRVESVSAGDLMRALVHGRDDKGGSVPTIPAYVMGNDGRAAPLRRTCSDDYKIAPQLARVRELIDRVGRKATDRRVLDLVGISTDELYRMKSSKTSWITLGYPLIAARMNRADCARLLVEHALPVPWKSSCVFCPWHDDETWLAIKTNWPEAWKVAVECDETIREPSHGREREAFLHRSLRPLAEIDFEGIVAARKAAPLFENAAVCDTGESGCAL